MAESASHRTANLFLTPSIFEIIAKDSLQNALYPALKRLVQVLTSTNKKYIFFDEWFDEIFLAFRTFLEFNYLSQEDASFSEAFYGLQRISSENKKLSWKWKTVCMIPLVILPYLKLKLEKISLKYKTEDYDGLLENDRHSELKRQIYQMEQVISPVWQLLKLIQYLSYISGNSMYPSPELSLLRVRLIRTETTRYAVPWSLFWNNFTKPEFWSSQIPFKIFGQIMFRSIEVGAFFIQFLQWWYSNNTVTDYSLIPVPKEPETIDNKAQQFRGVCPICLQRWKIPTILPTSGYVFCYRCIVRHLKIVSKCPVTNYPTTINELVRLYDE